MSFEFRMIIFECFFKDELLFLIKLLITSIQFFDWNFKKKKISEKLHFQVTFRFSCFTFVLI